MPQVRRTKYLVQLFAYVRVPLEATLCFRKQRVAQFDRVDLLEQGVHRGDHVAAIRSRFHEDFQLISFGVGSQDMLLHAMWRRYGPSATFPLRNRVTLPLPSQPVEELLESAI